MRILMLSQYYPPEPMRLLSDMAQSLQSLGHEVTVLTGFPNWPTGEVYPGYRTSLRKKEMMDGVPVVRIPLYPDHSKSARKRAMNFVSFPISACTFGPLFVKRPDIIHAIQPPTTCFAAWYLSKLWNVPFTYEVQDMWPETLSATGMVGSQRVLETVGRFCKWAYNKAAAVRVISPGFRENLLGKGVRSDKIHVIQNWVDTDLYKP
ncbi:glycosyltransferase family 4 protein, partial [bacterium]|nr:glycosyltransferase family 4 protein [bacterium]